MSKSLNNYIAIEEEPNEMYGKVMSVSDEVMWFGLRELTNITPTELENLRNLYMMEKFIRKWQRLLARTIVATFNNSNMDVVKEAELNSRIKIWKREKTYSR